MTFACEIYVHGCDSCVSITRGVRTNINCVVASLARLQNLMEKLRNIVHVLNVINSFRELKDITSENQLLLKTLVTALMHEKKNSFYNWPDEICMIGLLLRNL